MKVEEMNEGVRILIDRMKTHPEEFNYGVHERWYDIIEEIGKRAKGEANWVPFLYDEEVEAVQNQRRQLERDEFTATVMRRLTDTYREEEEQLELLPYSRAISSGPKMFTLSRAQFNLAKRLGVTPEVLVEALGKNNP